MIYPIDYLETKDIDWFSIVNGIPCHFSSNGGRLYPSIEEKREYNHVLQVQVSEMDYIFEDDLYINDSVVDTIISSVNQKFPEMNNVFTKETYTEYFAEMAKKGFFSYDNRYNPETEQMEYRLIAGPCSIKYYNENREPLLKKYPSFITKLLSLETVDGVMDRITVDKLNLKLI